jgi:hypothetical protein
MGKKMKNLMMVAFLLSAAASHASSAPTGRLQEIANFLVPYGSNGCIQHVRLNSTVDFVEGERSPDAVETPFVPVYKVSIDYLQGDGSKNYAFYSIRADSLTQADLNSAFAAKSCEALAVQGIKAPGDAKNIVQ